VKLLVVLLPIVIALTWARLIRPGVNHLEGTTLNVVPLPLLARMRMHALPSLFALALGFVLAATGIMSWWLMLLPLVSTILMMVLPVSYTLTDQGIRLGHAAFRRWTEFGGVRRAPGGARLQSVSGTRGMHIWLSRSRGDDEFLQVIRTLIKNAYKGKTGVVVFPGSRYTPPTINSATDAHMHGISAYRRDPLS
jgi:hypothetical protein